MSQELRATSNFILPKTIDGHVKDPIKLICLQVPTKEEAVLLQINADAAKRESKGKAGEGKYCKILHASCP